ncbi:MAG: hypothetical protein ACKVOA_08240 [Methylophilaceae bacterium]
MVKSQNALNIIANNITLLAVLVILLAGLAYFVTKNFGGESKAKRKFIFKLTGGVGLGIFAHYIFSQI